MNVRYLAFFTVFALLAFLMHAYLYRRLVRDPCPDVEARRRGRRVVWALGLLLVMGPLVARLAPRQLGVWAGYAAYGWMGLLALMVSILLVLDGVRLIERLWRRETPADPARRLALARGAAAVTMVAGGSAGAVGVRGALQAPELVEVEVPVKGLPPALVGFRVAQISDLHVGPTIGRSFVEEVVQRVNALDADMVAITGDLVDGTVARLGQHVAPLAALRSRHGSFFVTGNHEYYSGVEPWLQELERLDIQILRNARVELTHSDSEGRSAVLDVLGVDDWRARSLAEGHGHDLARACEGRDPSHPSLLLAHQPRAVHDAAKHGVDLMLSGHTHGGQIWPWGYFVRLIQPYVAGLHQHGDRTWIHVNRGTGYWGPPMRILTPPEITLVTLARSDA